MKTHIITVLLCCCGIMGFSQSVTTMEYFFNTDPGFGNATSITATTNTGTVTQTVSLPVNSLTGFNSLYLRAKDNLGKWSLQDKRVFYVADFTAVAGATKITAAEYFINTDPGLGMASPITINTNTGAVSQVLSLPTSANKGFNTLYIRIKDDLGVWSMYDRRIFYVSEATAVAAATKITAAEYFVNTDPGFGKAEPITVNTNTGAISQVLSLANTSNKGFNTLYIRTKDDLGVWSMYDRRIFYVSESTAIAAATKITAAEYFVNTDPGFGKATAVTVDANTGTLSQVLSLPAGSLQGFNTLYIRTKDDLGAWSMYDRRLFYVNKEDNSLISNITAAEYFYDADPKFGNGTAATIIPTAKPNEYKIELATTDISCGLHDFYIRLKNADGKWSLYDYKKGINVFDNAKPTIVIFPNITKELDATGKASVTIADVNNGTFDDCQLVSVVLNQAKIDYTCSNLGTNTVKVTATDAESKVSTQDVTITVVDKIKPVAIAKNITVQLDATGKVSILPAQINNSSTDNCSITEYSLDVSSFSCSNLGPNTVNLTVTDGSGNTSTAAAIVTVTDSTKPTVLTKAISVQLNASGTATIAANDIDNSSTDNCTLASKSIDKTSFTCANLGANTVTLTAVDQSGNTNSATAVVTIVDAIKPTALTKNVTVQLNSAGQASITTSQIDNGSTDNCSIVSSSLDKTNFTCSDLGTKTVTLSVTDASGNIGTQTATVTVEDAIKPVTITKNVSIPLDASGNATVTANDIDNSSTDNCGITSKSVDKTSFTCSNLGANTVTLTVTDASGNTNSTTATVTITDATKPTALGKDITVYLTGNSSVSILPSDIDNGSYDNCGAVSLSINVSSFNSKGSYPVVLTVVDGYGNSSSTTVTVTVDTALGIQESKQIANQISLFPNPATEYINIATNLILDTIQVLDTNGRTINTINNPTTKIEISHLPSGSYILKFNSKGKVLVKRFIKK
jgi:Secretion system C-terminal sorting domain